MSGSPVTAFGHKTKRGWRSVIILGGEHIVLPGYSKTEKAANERTQKWGDRAMKDFDSARLHNLTEGAKK
jgi:hypothetical protein